MPTRATPQHEWINTTQKAADLAALVKDWPTAVESLLNIFVFNMDYNIVENDTKHVARNESLTIYNK